MIQLKNKILIRKKTHLRFVRQFIESTNDNNHKIASYIMVQKNYQNILHHETAVKP